MTTGLIVALDTSDLGEAVRLAHRLRACGAMPKLGLEFFLAHGPAGVAEVSDGAPFFLDLKLHDIPNTVAGGIRSVLALRPSLLTIHASGGRQMIAAARKAIDIGTVDQPRPALLAVSVLTSLNEAALAETGVDDPPVTQVVRLARLALEAGADGLVCSPHEVAILRATFGHQPILVVPGIRPAGSAHGDQARVMTPSEAACAGASWIVVGRPITQSGDPAATAAAIVAELGAG